MGKTIEGDRLSDCHVDRKCPREVARNEQKNDTAWSKTNDQGQAGK